VARADCAVLCDIPFGMGNVRNLEALAGAQRLLSIESGPFDKRDYTGGIASQVFAGLPVAQRCAGTGEAVAAIEQIAKTTNDAGTEPREEEVFAGPTPNKPGRKPWSRNTSRCAVRESTRGSSSSTPARARGKRPPPSGSCCVPGAGT